MIMSQFVLVDYCHLIKRPVDFPADIICLHAGQRISHLYFTLN